MPLKSQAFSQPVGPVKFKQLYMRPTHAETAVDYIPRCYIEARIDYADVRTGYHMTCGLNHVLEFHAIDEDLVWTPDMMQTVDPAALQTLRPDGIMLRALPGHVNDAALARIETQYLKYLLKHAEARVYRNFALNIYSTPGESRDDFHARCIELLGDAFRSELDEIREVINRRLERLEHKHLRSDCPGEFESDRRATQARSRYFEMAEEIAQLFIGTELTMDSPANPRPHLADPARPDLEQSLEALAIDARQDIRRLLLAYQDHASNIDEYIIHPSLRDLHLVRTCVLWMPAKACET